MKMDSSPSKRTILYSMPELSIKENVPSCKTVHVHPFMQNCPCWPLLPINFATEEQQWDNRNFSKKRTTKLYHNSLSVLLVVIILKVKMLSKYFGGKKIGWSKCLGGHFYEWSTFLGCKIN